MIVVGFDQAPSGIGWAWGEPGSIPQRGFKELPDYGNAGGLRGDYVLKWAINFYKSCGAERVYFEQIIHRKFGFNAQTFDNQACVRAGIQIAAAQVGLGSECYETAIGDWRREFHNGARPARSEVSGAESAAWKHMALVECARRGWLIDAPPKIAHNIAEACGIWFFGTWCESKVVRTRTAILRRRAEHEADEARRNAL
jgi:hypothetical protein